MFSFLKILLYVNVSLLFFVKFLFCIQGNLKGKDDYLRLHWDDFNPNYVAKVFCMGSNLGSWVVNGTEHLLLSKNTPFDDKNALIGGVPVVFPIYGNWTFGRDNGFTKIVRWDIWDPPIKNWDTDVWNMSFRTRDLVFTRHMWNYHFRLLNIFSINKNILTMTLKLHNREEKNIFHFKLGYRNHIRVPEVTESTIQGLKGATYLDNTKPPEMNEQPTRLEDKEDVRITKWTDRLYPYAPKEIVVTNVAGGKNLKITTINFPDIAVWHPWNDHYRPDEVFADDEYRQFVGIHTGVFREYYKLGPNETYEATQIFELF